MANVEVRGLQELGRTLDLLSANLERVAIRKATAKGLEVYRREIRATAPVREQEGTKKLKAGKTREAGYLKKHIGRWMRKNADGSFSGFVGPTPSAFYGRFVEKGHRIVHGKALARFQRAEFGGANVPAHPFLRPAFDRKTDEAFAAFRDEMIAQLGELAK